MTVKTAKFKRTIASLLAASLVLPILPMAELGGLTVTAAEAVQAALASENRVSEGLEFTSNGDGTCYVSGIGYCTDTDLVIPSTSPNGDSVTTIGEYAFSWCSSLMSITIPDSVTTIDYRAFYGCSSLTSVVIGDSVTTIGEDAFSGCSSLTSVVIGDSVTSIGTEAFSGCSSLTSVVIGDSVTSIGTEAFSGCSSLTSVVIGDSVTSIGWYAFEGCSSLTSVEIGDSVTTISSYAFYGCSSLTSVVIPDSVTTIGGDAFSQCSSLTSVVIGDSVTTIGEYAFSWCSSLMSITIPDSVTTIDYRAFYGCSSLTSVVIGDSVTTIGEDAFSGCSGLTSITIPDSVTTIGDWAFYNCSGLTSITIPDSVTTIGYHAFSGCSSLYQIQNNSSLTLTIGSTGDGYVAYWAKVIIDKDGNKTYKDANSGFEYVDTADGFRFIKENGAYTLIAYLGSEETITLPQSIDGNSYTISYFRGGRNVIIPGGVTSIGQYAFSGCSSLTSITIPDSVTTIGDDAFSGCNSLTSVVIPSGVTSIGAYSFASCYYLCDVKIYGSPNIGNAAFGWRRSVESKIFFFGSPTSIYDSEYTIDSDTVIYCYADDTTVKNYAQKYDRKIKYLSCKNGCEYGEFICEDFLYSLGSCNERSVYYVACEICRNVNEELTFEGDFVHSYTQQNISDAYLKTFATCTDKAVYYLSCICGLASEDFTFTYGEALGHNYDDCCDESCNRCSFVREAPHNVATTYDYDYHHHWYPCLLCEMALSYAPHEYDDDHDTFCNICTYERTIYVISYDANSGENAPSASYVPFGSAGTVSSDFPTKEKFVFIGWATEANGMVEYEGGDSLNLTQSITLYAVWKAECQECDGTGQTYTTRTCTSCTSGYVYSSSCYYCHGRGKYSTGDMSCSNCYGSGQVKDPYGSGKYVNCLMCGGDGVVPDYQTCYYCRSKCTVCKGSAKVTDYFDCENCDAHGYYDSFDVHYNANGGFGAPSSQSMGGKTDVLSDIIPSREGFVFVGWNTLIDNNAIYQPGEVYYGGTVTFYAMWAPACPSCAGAGLFTQGEVCGSCNGNGTYNATVKICNSCGGNHVVTYVTGYRLISYCSNCGSTSVRASTQTKNCSNCTNGIVDSTYECEDCEGSGYLQIYPKALSFSDNKVVLLKIDGMEYSIDGINWQDSNVFTELLPATGYSFYQRIKATENAPFGFISAPLLLRTDKADNEDTPPIPVAVEITAESIRVDVIDGCEYSIDGVNWQSDPLFANLDCATNYTVYARFAETDTHYASQAISYTVVRTEKGTVSAPSMPTLVAVGRDRVILQKLEGYEYSIGGINWQSSNVFLGLESKTNYFIYCRFAETDQYYASSPSEALIVKTSAESEVGPTYEITFQDEYGNILSQAYYELYDEITIPSTYKESDLTYTYTFLHWDKAINELCMGEAVYTATYEKQYIDYEVVFKDYDGVVISSHVYHYGDSVVIPTNPTKEADLAYTYIFAGWDKTVVDCVGDATYTATYDMSYIDYMVVFKDYETGDIYYEATLPYGTVIIPPADPTKEGTSFNGWNGYTEGMTVTGDVVITAKWHQHDLTQHPAQAPTCTEIGWNAYETCSRCDYTTYAEFPANGHTYTHTVVSPTTSAEGYTLHTCTDCGDSYKDNFIDKLTYILGDVNADEQVDSADAIHLLRHTLFPMMYSLNQSGDFNGDSSVDSADAIHLLRHTLFPSMYPLKSANAD